MNNFGRDNLMVIAAFRYCLGRASYIVGDCVDWLRQIWPELSDRDRRLIKKEIIEALSLGRAGHERDRYEWLKVMELEDGK